MRIFKNKMFFKWSRSENLSDSILIKAAKEISEGLIDANLGGNLLKKRIARKGHGKSGGFRTIVIFKIKFRVFFVYGFPKNKRDNINDKEEKALKKLAQYLLNASEDKLKEMLINCDLYEVLDEQDKKK